jgi:5-methylcytosine-specific restriction endonuclease McrA
MIVSRRKKPRPGRLKGEDLIKLRHDCYLRDNAICQKCGIFTLWVTTNVMATNLYHMAHIKAKRMGGDTLENVETLCGDCHRRYHLWGPSMEKPCKAKGE